jgi:diguanylate cyclase (GGDEF)-like protein
MAFRHLTALKRLDDEARNVATSTSSALMAARFDAVNQEARIARLRADQIRRDADLSASRVRVERLTTVGGLALVAFLIIFAIGALAFRTVRRSRDSVHDANVKLNRAARHDALTDLPNRGLLRERLEEAIAGARSDEKVAVLCLDLDRFKEVNDTLGHRAGDSLLKAVAERLRGCVGDVDTLARLGGDEFSIVQVAGEQPVAATSLASRILEDMSAPYELNGQQVVAGASIGIAVSPGDGSEADQLIKNADLALHRAKSEGRATYRFFEAEMDAEMQVRCQLQADLRNALANGEFDLHYQPVVNLARNEICGLEALLRWHHPVRGSIPPGAFIPVAEETGLIVPLGEWALRQACAQAAAWPENIKVAVNLSPVQFKSRNLVEMVFAALASSGLSASRLELEITESVVTHHPEQAVVLLKAT